MWLGERRLSPRTGLFLRGQHAGKSLCVFPRDDRGHAVSAQGRIARTTIRIGPRRDTARSGVSAVVLPRVARQFGSGSRGSVLVAPRSHPVATAGGGGRHIRRSKFCDPLDHISGVRANRLVARLRRVPIFLRVAQRRSFRPPRRLAHTAGLSRGQPLARVARRRLQNPALFHFIGAKAVGDNTYLTLLAETGIPGLFAVIALNIAILVYAYRAARSPDTVRSFTGAWMLCFWAGQSVQMLSADLLTYWRVLPVYFFVLALATRTSQ